MAGQAAATPSNDGLKYRSVKPVLSLTTSWRAVARVWLAQRNDGFRCELVQVDRFSMKRPILRRDATGMCHRSALPEREPIAFHLSWVKLRRGFGVLLSGGVGPQVKRLVIHSSTGQRKVLKGRGAFLAELPRSASNESLPSKGAPYVLVGYDGAGTEIVRFDLTRLVARKQ